MAKAAKKIKTPKPKKYDGTAQLNGSFEDVIKALVNTKKPIKNSKLNNK
jgi:hypothetical protein